LYDFQFSFPGSGGGLGNNATDNYFLSLISIGVGGQHGEAEALIDLLPVLFGNGGSAGGYAG
jgi:hypothetical protein